MSKKVSVEISMSSDAFDAVDHLSLSLQQQYLPTHSAICRRPRHMNKGFGRQSAGNQDHTTSSTVAECSKQGRNASTSSSLYLLLSSRAACSTTAVVEELNWE